MLLVSRVQLRNVRPRAPPLRRLELLQKFPIGVNEKIIIVGCSGYYQFAVFISHLTCFMSCRLLSFVTRF